MGLFGLFKSDEDRRADELRSGARAPSRSERQRCWESRDLYYACLDGAGIVDAVRGDKAARAACGPETARFEADCAAQWVRSLPLAPAPFLVYLVRNMAYCAPAFGLSEGS